MTSEYGSAEPADVLLVEDNPGDIRLTKEAFKDGKIANTLHVVENGVDALDFLFQRNDYADAPRPDIVLLDLNLPRKNGDEVLAELHEDSNRRRIPVIVHEFGRRNGCRQVLRTVCERLPDEAG